MRTNKDWTPPDEEARKAALGSMLRCPKDLVAACSTAVVVSADHDSSENPPAGCFLPKTPPEPGQWLAKGSPGETERNGQTYHEFEQLQRKARRRRFPTHQQRTIYFCNIDKDSQSDAALAMMDRLKAFVIQYFGMSCQVLTPPLSDAERETFQTRYHPWPQYKTGPIYDILSCRMLTLPDAFCVVGITLVDLYPNKAWNFVFGEANPSTGTGIFSFARYTDDFDQAWRKCRGKGRKHIIFDPTMFEQTWPSNPEETASGKKLLLRAMQTLVHEIGHLFHLNHCVYYQCLMNGANNLEEADEAPLHLCPICLRKLHTAVGMTGYPLDIVGRYAKLSKFLQDMGMQDQAKWYSATLKRCQSALMEEDAMEVEEEGNTKQEASY